MLKECIETGKTVDQAIESACSKLGLSTDQVSFEIIELPRKSMFGLKIVPAKVRVYVELPDAPEPKPEPKAPVQEKPVRTPEKREKPAHENVRHDNRPAQQKPQPKPEAKPEAKPQPAPEQPPKELTAEELALIERKKALAVEYLTAVLTDIGLTDCTVHAQSTSEGVVLTLSGEDMGVIIGRRGETLDSLQYLVGLVANRLGGSYLRVTIDSGNFREKREKTLQALARRLGSNVLKTGKPITLEPMNPYERRIIHAVVSSMEGATSTSVGEEPNRRVVISSKTGRRQSGGYKGKPGGGPRGGDKNGASRYPRGPKPGGAPDARQGGSRPPRQGGFNKNAHPRPQNAPVPSSAPKAEPRSEAKDKPLYSKIVIED